MAPPIQTIPTLNQTGMNIAVSSFVQATNTQKTAQSMSTAKEIEHKSLQDVADIQVLKEAGQVGTLTASAIVNPYNDKEKEKEEQEFFAEHDEDEEENSTEEDENSEFTEQSENEIIEYSTQSSDNIDDNMEYNEQAQLEEEASNEPFLGQVLNIKV